MDHVNYFKDMFKSIPDYRNIVFLIFLIKNDVDFLNEYGFFLKCDITRVNNEFKSILMEQNEEYLNYIKNEEKSIFEKTLIK